MLKVDYLFIILAVVFATILIFSQPTKVNIDITAPSHLALTSLIMCFSCVLYFILRIIMSIK